MMMEAKNSFKDVPSTLFEVAFFLIGAALGYQITDYVIDLAHFSFSGIEKELINGEGGLLTGIVAVHALREKIRWGNYYL